jgi:hypothetical protein
MDNQIAINDSPQTFTVTLTLTGADYEWLAAYVQVTGHSLDESVTKMIAGSLNEEPINWFHIKDLLDTAHKSADKQRAPKKSRAVSTRPPVTDEQWTELSKEMDLAGRVFKVNRKSHSALRRPGRADRLRARALGVKLTWGEFFQGQNQ